MCWNPPPLTHKCEACFDTQETLINLCNSLTNNEKLSLSKFGEPLRKFKVLLLFCTIYFLFWPLATGKSTSFSFPLPLSFFLSLSAPFSGLCSFLALVFVCVCVLEGLHHPLWVSNARSKFSLKNRVINTLWPISRNQSDPPTGREAFNDPHSTFFHFWVLLYTLYCLNLSLYEMAT